MRFLLLPILVLGFLGLPKGFCQYLIKGKVTDASTNDPVPFATVSLKGTTLGTVTDFEGNFTLAVKNLADSLGVSYLRYKTKWKAVNKSKAAQTIDV